MPCTSWVWAAHFVSSSSVCLCSQWSNGCLPLTLQLLMDTAFPSPCKHLLLEVPIIKLHLPFPSQSLSSTNLLITPSLFSKTLAPATWFSSPLQIHLYTLWLQLSCWHASNVLSQRSLTSSNSSNNAIPPPSLASHYILHDTSYGACHLLELHSHRNLSISHFTLSPSNVLCPYSQCFGSSTSLELHLLDPPFSYSFSSIFPTQSRSHKALFSNLEVPGHFLFLPHPSHQPPTLKHQPTCRPVLEVGVARGLSTVEEYLFTLFSEVCCVLVSPFLVMFLLGKPAGEAKKKPKKL